MTADELYAKLIQLDIEFDVVEVMEGVRVINFYVDEEVYDSEPPPTPSDYDLAPLVDKHNKL